ncbi:hypothetical protein EV356DRAFT_510930 [Viridothelium virens]|uniref:Uncharacterized protein n=1 Tax=Viridothelium virens TaxID=1048519 RepID=A0A6A6GV90_VIRVR|nr:hypothetical protein EV356DRAFT_510930 [Viridothelium virens]
MRPLYSFLAVLGLLSIGDALPGSVSDFLMVTNIKLRIPPPAQLSCANTTISFTVQDVNPIANCSATCSGTWPVASDQYPTGPYVPCDDAYAWNFANAGYNGPHNFTLQIEHIYEDHSLGPPPYDSRSTFAHTTVNKTSIRCHKQKDGARNCLQPLDLPIKAPIWMES